MNKKLYLLPLAGLLLAGCSADNLAGIEGQLPISLTAEIEDMDVSTRAATTVLNAFATDDAFYAYFPSDVRVGSATSGSSTTFTLGSNSTWSPATQPYFNAGAESATVHAYHPDVTGKQVTNTTTSFSVETDQSTDANYKKSDLMYATTTIDKGTTATATGSLTFAHRMAKIIVNATASSGISQIQAVRIVGGYRTINIATPLSCTLGTTLSDANTPSGTYISMYADGTTASATCAALLPPQTVGENAETAFLQVVTDVGTATYSLSNKTFESGKSYTYNITITAAQIGVTTDITDWDSQGDTNLYNFGEASLVAPGPGALSGKFTIASGRQVYFSQGNLRATYDGSSWTWSFAENQWDYIGDAEGNTKVTSSAPFVANYTGSSTTVDLFGWVGASSTWTGVNMYGITSSTTTANKDGYGDGYDEALKADWGTLPISNGGNTANSGWRTLTEDEWRYVFDTRSPTSGIRYARAQVNGVNGVILLPDHWSASYYELTSPNTGNATYTSNSISLSDWNSSFAPRGCVFLPAAGSQYGPSVDNAGSDGYYWSSTSFQMFSEQALVMYFLGAMNPYCTSYSFRHCRNSVRLVRDAYHPLAEVTTNDVGKVICSLGHIHSTVSEATAAGCTASGIIAYVGAAGTADKSTNSGSYKGLALALYDYGGSLTTDGTTCKWYTTDGGTCITNGQSTTLSTVIGTTGGFGTGIDNTNRLATAACGSGHTHAAAQNAKNFGVARPTGASQWFLPTMYQWNLMVKAMCGKSTNLSTSTNNDYKADKFNEKITAAGGRGVLSGYYWSSVEYSTSFAWGMNFGNGYADYDYGKSRNVRVRAVFAF